jgi:hypothetical protein
MSQRRSPCWSSAPTRRRRWRKKRRTSGASWTPSCSASAPSMRKRCRAPLTLCSSGGRYSFAGQRCATALCDHRLHGQAPVGRSNIPPPGSAAPQPFVCTAQAHRVSEWSAAFCCGVRAHPVTLAMPQAEESLRKDMGAVACRCLRLQGYRVLRCAAPEARKLPLLLGRESEARARHAVHRGRERLGGAGGLQESCWDESGCWRRTAARCAAPGSRAELVGALLAPAQERVALARA